MRYKKLSCRTETARRFVSLNILLSQSRLLKTEMKSNDESDRLYMLLSRLVAKSQISGMSARCTADLSRKWTAAYAGGTV